VDSIHTLYYEEHGRLWNVDDDNNNEKGEEEDNSTTLLSTEPGTTSSKTLLHALFLHGGPGAGCSPRHAQFFDPSRYHIVLFDQRGSGHSVPRGDVRHNTLHDVVEDCETLRRQLNISQWHVMLGGSWGSTVAIAYAQQYPMVIQTMVLRGVCLLRPCEVNWLFGSSSGNMAMRLPQAWNDFCQAVGVVTTTLTSSSSTITDDTSQDDDITVEVVEQDPREALYAYYDRLLGDNPILRWKAARSWMTWEQAVASSASLSNSIVRSMEEDTAQLQHNKEQNQQHSSPPLVLVSSTLSSAALDGTDDSSSSSSLWSYQGLSGQLISNPSLLEQLEPPEHAVERLRQGLSCLPEDGGGTVPIFTPRPIRPVLDDLSERNITLSLEESEALSSFLPVQSMLTCYFSVNERYVLNNTPLLHATRMTRLLQYYAQQQQQPPLDEHHHGIMKVIAIHGGQDCICPLDNALELLRAWPNNNMELRVPLQAGHSMYDPAVTHEIIQATDRLANVSDAQS
jgi:proline iminopeptidase